ncbi:MAG: hypothetical protein OXC57_11375 [Rhodobacteraceae bacterium]|nr:hypothetical protein [Paracoccaceae bacterium]
MRKVLYTLQAGFELDNLAGKHSKQARHLLEVVDRVRENPD